MVDNNKQPPLIIQIRSGCIFYVIIILVFRYVLNDQRTLHCLRQNAHIETIVVIDVFFSISSAVWILLLTLRRTYRSDESACLLAHILLCDAVFICFLFLLLFCSFFLLLLCFLFGSLFSLFLCFGFLGLFSFFCLFSLEFLDLRLSIRKSGKCFFADKFFLVVCKLAVGVTCLINCVL